MCTGWITCTPKFKIRCCCVFFRHQLHSGGYPPWNPDIKIFGWIHSQGLKMVVIFARYLRYSGRIVQIVQHRNDRNRHQKSPADACNCTLFCFSQIFLQNVFGRFSRLAVQCTLTPHHALYIITTCFCWIGLVSQIMNTTSARIYRPSFRENKPKTLVFSHI